MFVCSIVQIWYHGIYFNVSCVSTVTRENYKKKVFEKIFTEFVYLWYDCNTQTFYKNFHGIRGACLSSDHWRSALGGGGWGCRFCGSKPKQRSNGATEPADQAASGSKRQHRSRRISQLVPCNVPLKHQDYFDVSFLQHSKHRRNPDVLGKKTSGKFG
jgi:hypothetical protein